MKVLCVKILNERTGEPETDGSLQLIPERWARKGFWDDFFNQKNEAIKVFEEERKKISNRIHEHLGAARDGRVKGYAEKGQARRRSDSFVMHLEKRYPHTRNCSIMNRLAAGFGGSAS
jgi:hypothetical protein